MSRTGTRIGTILVHIALWLAVLATLGPILYTLMTSLKYFRDIISAAFPFEPTLANYQELFVSARSNFLPLTFNSVSVSAVTTLVVVIIASLGAYSLSRFRWRGAWSGVLLGWLLFLHMLPPIILIGPFYLISFMLGIYDRLLAVIMAHVVINLPLAVWMLQSYFAEVPSELEDAAAIDGCNRFMTFTRVVLPLTRPGIAATAVLVFVFSWNDFIFALTLTSTPRAMTIPVGISTFAQQWQIRYGEMAAASFFAMVPALVLVIIAQRHILRGLTLGALKG